MKVKLFTKKWALLMLMGSLWACKADEKTIIPSSMVSEILGSGTVENSRFLVAIPQTGCPYCIEAALKFLKNDLGEMEPQPMGYIFIQVRDKKALALRHKSILSSQQVAIDENHLFEKHIPYATSYPILFEKNKQGNFEMIEQMNTDKAFIWENFPEYAKVKRF